MPSTRELKAAYRKGIERLKTEQDPLRRHLLLQMTYAIKVDLARRIKFKGAKKSLWKQLVDTVRIAKVLNERYIADVPSVAKEDPQHEIQDSSDRRERPRTRRMLERP